MRKRGVLAAMLTGVMLVLCGCGGMTTDEAKDYVKICTGCRLQGRI